ncbi:MAG: hypothetical protein JRE18_07350 [Deltaproteobacteria bacterium]|nr:hypothetical protein [Deltaproteobacteria bacterium]
MVAWLAFWAGLAAGTFALGMIVRQFIAHRGGEGLAWTAAGLGPGGLVGAVMFIVQTDQLLGDFETGFRSLASASSGYTIMFAIVEALTSIGLLRDTAVGLPQSTTPDTLAEALQ